MGLLPEWLDTCQVCTVSELYVAFPRKLELLNVILPVLHIQVFGEPLLELQFFIHLPHYMLQRSCQLHELFGEILNSLLPISISNICVGWYFAGSR